MDHQTIADPFPDPTKHNTAAIEALHREITRPVFDPVATKAKIKEIAKSKRWDAPTQDENAQMQEAWLSAASADWSDLQKLALRRTGAAIVVADGVGKGITQDELEGLAGREARKNSLTIFRTARAILKRLLTDHTVAGAGIDAIILEADPEMAKFLPENE